jgi:hypothetical protein
MSTLPVPPSKSLSFLAQPTQGSLTVARDHLDALNNRLNTIRERIFQAESQLAQIVAESRCNIDCMAEQEREIAEEAKRYQAYLSPIRRLPEELLREVFNWSFVAYPCCAWVFASVCKSWRRLALATPKIWSKVCCTCSFSSLLILASQNPVFYLYTVYWPYQACNICEIDHLLPWLRYAFVARLDSNRSYL